MVADRGARCVYYNAFETRSLPTLARCFPRSFTFYVAFPKSSIRLSVWPSMSLASPAAPLYLGSSRRARPLPRGLTGHVAHSVRDFARDKRPKTMATAFQ